MRKSRFSEDQIIAILKESEAGVETGELCRRHGIATGVFLPMEKQVRRDGSERGKTAEAAGGGKPAAEAHRGGTGGGHSSVEGGGGKKVVSPQARREAVLVMQLEVELSQRRACGLMELYRATCRYRKRKSEDQLLRVRLRELAEARRRFGYRRLQILLQREGWQVNHKRVTCTGCTLRRSCRCGASVGGSAARCVSRCRQPWPPTRCGRWTS